MNQTLGPGFLRASRPRYLMIGDKFFIYILRKQELGHTVSQLVQIPPICSWQPTCHCHLLLNNIVHSICLDMGIEAVAWKPLGHSLSSGDALVTRGFNIMYK